VTPETPPAATPARRGATALAATPAERGATGPASSSRTTAGSCVRTTIGAGRAATLSRVGALTSLTARVRGLERDRADALLATACSAAGLVPVAFYAGSHRALPAVAVTLLQGAGLALRRRAALVGLALNLAAYVGLQRLGARMEDAAVPQFIALLFGVYSAGANLAGARLVVAAVAIPALLVVAMAVDPYDDSAGGTIASVLVLWLAPMLAGCVVRSRGELNRLLHARGEALRAQRARAAEDAVAQERERIAGELHDVVAHALSAMVVQAAAARRRAPADAAQARAAFEAVEGTGREALTEIRRLLGVLRREDEELALAPQPSLAHVSSLVRRARLAGLEVHLRIDGTARPLPAGVDLTAYRVVQLALGSALEGAGAGRADVHVRYCADEVVVEIRDDGSRVVRPLPGVRERVSLYGGELHAGVRRGGGHGVRARLPLGGVA
jgi:signal transduction histidine kinase